jgi:Ca2+-binding RTX toxin-like protein
MSTHDTRRIGRAGIAAGAAAALAAGITLAGPVAPAGADADDNTVAIVGDALVVTATDGADSVALRLAPAAPGTLQVDFGDDGVADASVDRAGFARIEVFLRRGSDAFRVDQVNGAFADEILTVDGSGGNDTFAGGDGAETFRGGAGKDTADGNRGDDLGIMGSGTDSFRWDPGDGSDTIEGEGGADTLDFNGAAANEIMSLTPNGGRALFLRDVANIRMDMDGVERLDLTALGGTDTVNVDDMSGTDFGRADIDLQGPAGGGDGAVDLVTVSGTGGPDDVVVRLHNGAIKVDGLQVRTSIIGQEPTDRLQVNTLAGDDDVTVAPDAAAAIAVAVDLGADG